MDFEEQLNSFVKKLGFSEEEIRELKNSWVYQKNGVINKFKDYHRGTQPIRVMHEMILFMFANTYPAFKDKLQQMVDQGKLNPQIDMIYAEEGIIYEGIANTPRVNANTRQITIHETFLSYLWCVSYAIYILYIEKVDYPNLNKKAGQIIYPVSEDEIIKAKELFNYGKSLIAYFSPWDKDYLPNPELYHAERRNYIEQAAMCYNGAVIFILTHELTHLELHLDQLKSDTPDSNYLAFEKEADRLAIEHTIKARNQMGDIIINSGIIVGLLSMLYFNANTTGKRHPAVEDRITYALEFLDLNERDPAWGMACVGLELWEEQFNLQFDWLPNADSPKHQYYHILDQIKKKTDIIN
jgi:hypothetical protein